MNKFSYALFLSVVFFYSCSEKSVKIWTVDNVPNPKAIPGWNYISDPDSLLSGDAVAGINQYLKDLEQSTTDQGAVVVLGSIGNKVPRQFANELLRKWGVGQKDKDNGFLLLMVIDQRRVEFEVGYGLEGTLTDLSSKRIQEQYMLPHAREGDYSTAALEGIEQICLLLKEEMGIDSYGGFQQHSSDDNSPFSDDLPAMDTQTEERFGRTNFFDNLFGYLFLSIFFIVPVVVFSYLGKAKSGKDFTKKYKTRSLLRKRIFFIDLPYLVLFIIVAGAFSFLKTVLMFYGYGVLRGTISAILVRYWLKKEVAGKEREEVYTLSRQAYLHWSRWIRYTLPVPFYFYFRSLLSAMDRLRNEPVFTVNGKAMTRLDEAADDEHLKSYQIKEEELNTVDYDVWYESETGEKKIFRYELFGKYDPCPKCKAITYKMTANNVLRAATYSSSGKGVKVYQCQYCSYEKKAEYVIPRLEASSSSSSSGSSSSSSSSSGGSSWGGGSSGGGGAGSSW